MIDSFDGKYSWLSNFAPAKISLENVTYSSIEHAYISAKSNGPGWKDFCVDTKSPGELKKAGRKVKLVHDWEKIKVSVMYVCLLQKFNQEPYKTLLINTGNEHIQEGNWWNDKFWGVDLNTGEGENTLGKLIMSIRKELLEGNNG